LRSALWLAMALPVAGLAQNNGTNSPYTGSQQRGFPQQETGPLSAADGSNPIESEKRMRLINADRQKSLVADTNRLLALATELRNEIAQSNTGDLTPEQIRKIAEIEKLAHSVKEKMSMSLRSPALNMESPPFLPSIH
jgi:hypothetical protein